MAYVSPTPADIPMPRTPRMVRYALVMAGATTTLAALVLIGWTFDITLLKSIVSTWAQMKVNTAVCFLMGGIALWRVTRIVYRGEERTDAVTVALITVLLLISGLTLFEHAADRNIGIDQLFFADAVPLVFPGRMAYPTSVAIVLLGLVLLSVPRRASPRRVTIEAVMMLPMFYIGLLSLANYVYGVQPRAAWRGYSSLPFHTSLALLAMSTGTLAVRGREGLLGVLSSATTGGRLARQMLPWIVVGPIAVGWISERGETLGLYGHEFGLSLFAVTTVVIFAVLVWWSAQSVREADTEVMRTTSELAVVESRYQRFFSESPVALYRTTPDGAILDANLALAMMLGYDTPAELVGVDARAHHVNPAVRDEFRLVMEQSRVVEARTTELRAKDGVQFWVVDTTVAVRDSAGRVLHYEGCLVDVTEGRTAEERVAASERRFRALIEQSNDGIALLGADGGIRYESPAAERILGRKQAERFGAAFDEFVHVDDQAKIRLAFTTASAAPGAVSHAAIRVKRGDDSWRWIEANMTNRLTDAEVGAIVVNFRDVTELRHAEERFIDAQRMDAVGRLAGGIAHDFNNLLTVIIAASEYVQMRMPPGSEEQEMLLDVRRASDSAAALTRQLLTFSRRQLVEPVVLDVNDVVTDITKLLRRMIGEDIKVETRLAADVGTMRVDRGQLEQVLTNMAVNARDAMPRGGVLTIETQRAELDDAYAATHHEVTAGVFVMIAVSDTGTGMSPDVASKVFEPFFTTKGPGAGTGLGLATCHGIVKQAGGHITLYTEPKHGSTFKLYFPRSLEKPAVPVASVAPRRGSGQTVLVVEDDAGVRRVAERMLTVAGYSVITAPDAERALSLLRRMDEPPALLFADVVLPGMGGRELSEAARELFPALRVLFASGYTNDVILQRQLLAHDVVILQKPYTSDQLATKVRDALDR